MKKSMEAGNYKHFVPPGLTLISFLQKRHPFRFARRKTLPEKVQHWHYIVRRYCLSEPGAVATGYCLSEPGAVATGC
jgi:hypothetical protein